MRIGIGYDSHPFEATRPLVLGGVRLPAHPGLSGHSDGDAVAHAVTDALLGAAGLGSIGERFPDTDPSLAGADSLKLLSRAVAFLTGAGYRPVNVDVTVVAETPPIAPHASAMAARLAEAIGVSAGAVSVKGKRNEGMGWIGRGEGLAVMAVALVARARGAEVDDEPTGMG